MAQEWKGHKATFDFFLSSLVEECCLSHLTRRLESFRCVLQLVSERALVYRHFGKQIGSIKTVASVI